MRRYFITGGTGFVGRAIVRELLKRKDTESILCLTRGRPDLIQHKKLTFWRGDITDVEFPSEEHKFTDLIHGAAEANDLLHPDQHGYYYAVVEGTRRLFEWAEQRTFSRCLFISSGAVRKGDSAYCRAKRLSESLVERSTFPTKIARLYSVIGEELPIDGQYALGRFVGSALRGCVEYYESQSVRSYLHVEDAARALIDILERGRSETPYDVGSLISISVVELAHLVAEVFGVPVKKVKSEHHPTAEIYLPSSVDYWKTNETITLEKSLERIRDTLTTSYVDSLAKVH